MLLRKKWRYLRDQYAVETSKIPRALEGSYTPKWPPFKSLHFLKGVIPRRDRKRKVRRSSSNTSDDQNDEQSDMAAMSYQEDESHDPFEDEVDVKPSRKKLIFASSNNAITYQEERPKEEDDNEHMYFFKSLLPHVREIPRRRLLAFRSCIQAIVEDFAYSTDANSSRFHQQPFQNGENSAIEIRQAGGRRRGVRCPAVLMNRAHHPARDAGLSRGMCLKPDVFNKAHHRFEACDLRLSGALSLAVRAWNTAPRAQRMRRAANQPALIASLACTVTTAFEYQRTIGRNNWAE
ncbi:unnamed protein product [Chilo suppressalis]|uniref:BESS domain-containing protein n=1 Tax=Chilo suppressalis TaxID=168631 RepID=A0ABN8AXS4_CHISP|nr:unnamed protein product [Chilo suppressalis]